MRFRMLARITQISTHREILAERFQRTKKPTFQKTAQSPSSLHICLQYVSFVVLTHAQLLFTFNYKSVRNFYTNLGW